MNIRLVSSRLCILTLCIGGLISGCVLVPVQVPATFSPVQGPLAAQTPRPAYAGQFTAQFSQLTGPVTVTLENGETFTGAWQPTRGLPKPTVRPPGAVPSPDLSADWDLVYGAGYFRAHVVGAAYQARALLTGSAGDTGVIELAHEHGSCGHMRGVARDSHQNVYQVSTFVDCPPPATAASFNDPVAPGLSGPGPGPSFPGAPSNGPTLVIPATGGPPIIAIPAGGNVYIPVTGGAPIPGTPIP